MGSLARVAHFVRRLTDWRKPDRSFDPDHPRSGVAQKNPKLEHLQRTRRELKVQLAALEAELGQLHVGLSEGRLPHVRNQAGRTITLEESIRRSRELRDQLGDVQGELLRIERHIARERILEPSDAEPSRTRTVKRSAPRAHGDAARAEPGIDATRRRTATRILEGARYVDHAQRQTVEAAARGLFDRSESVRRDSVARLGATGSQVGLDLVQLTVDDPSPRVRFAALTALVGAKSPAVVRVFRRFLHDQNAQTRLAALRGLATSKHESAARALITALEDRDPEVRKTATTLLGWVPVATGTPHLAFALRDPEESVRVAAAEALGSSSDYRATLPLIRALADGSQNVRQAAEQGLQSVLGRHADAILTEGMTAEDRVLALKAWWRHARPELLAHGETVERPVPVEAPAPRPSVASDALRTTEAFESPVPEAESEAPAAAAQAVEPEAEPEDQFGLPSEEAAEEEEGASLFEGGDDQFGLPSEAVAGEDEGDHVSLLGGDEGEDQLALPGDEGTEKESAGEEDNIMIGGGEESGDEEESEESEAEGEGEGDDYEKLF